MRASLGYADPGNSSSAFQVYRSNVSQPSIGADATALSESPRLISQRPVEPPNVTASLGFPGREGSFQNYIPQQQPPGKKWGEVVVPQRIQLSSWRGGGTENEKVDKKEEIKSIIRKYIGEQSSSDKMSKNWVEIKVEDFDNYLTKLEEKDKDDYEKIKEALLNGTTEIKDGKYHITLKEDLNIVIVKNGYVCVNKDEMKDVSKKNEIDGQTQEELQAISVANKALNMKSKQQKIDLLLKMTMYVYNIILSILIILCIVSFILGIINIIKFLYKSFIDIGKSEHNDLLTKDTFRYKLLNYILYVNTSDIPTVFQGFNQKGDGKIKTLENILTLIKPSANIAATTGAANEERRDLDNTLKRSGVLVADEVDEVDKYIDNRQVDEPFFIFSNIKILLLSGNLLLSFIMIVIIVFIILITINLLSSNEDETEFKIFKKQNFFDLQLILILFSIIYIIIQLILYTVLFTKVYEKYLDTFLSILNLDIKIEYLIEDINNNLLNFVKEEHNIFNESVHKILENIVNGQFKEKIINGILKVFYNKGIDLTTEGAEDTGELDIMISILKLYILINHIDEEIENSDSKIANIYIKKGKTNKDDFNLDNMYYSHLKNNNRNKEIPYFLIDHDKLNSIEINPGTKITQAEKTIINKNLENKNLRKEINKFIKDINKNISDINIKFNDENYILDLGIYLLLFVIIGSIYITIVIITIIKAWTNIESSNKFRELLEIN